MVTENSRRGYCSLVYCSLVGSNRRPLFSVLNKKHVFRVPSPQERVALSFFSFSHTFTTLFHSLAMISSILAIGFVFVASVGECHALASLTSIR